MVLVRRVTLTIAVAVLLGGPTSAQAKIQRAHSGGVSAAFSFTGRFPSYRDERLTISRAGVVVYDKPVSSEYCGSGCAPGALSAHASSVQIQDLNGDGEPEVRLDLYTGGAHCCTVEQVFAFDPGSGTYVKREHDFGDPAYTLQDLDHNGRVEFVTRDDLFAFTFTDYAASGLPLQILIWSGQRFVDVTRRYPALIGADAKHWLRRFKHSRTDTVGFIAAWAADEYLLGHKPLVKRTLATAVKQGRLRSAVSPALPGGRSFVRSLYRFLRKHGY